MTLHEQLISQPSPEKRYSEAVEDFNALGSLLTEHSLPDCEGIKSSSYELSQVKSGPIPYDTITVDHCSDPNFSPALTAVIFSLKSDPRHNTALRVSLSENNNEWITNVGFAEALDYGDSFEGDKDIAATYLFDCAKYIYQTISDD